MRLVSADVVTDEGESWIGIEIDMPSSVKTYWQVPGETGIPLTLDTTGSKGVQGATIAWPFPLRETGKGYVDHVYYGHVVIPVALKTRGEAIDLVADVRLGVCSEVCVPAHARFEHTFVLGERDAAQALRIAQARAEVPLPATSDQAPFAAITADRDQHGLVVETRTDGPRPSEVIAHLADVGIVFGPPQERAGGEMFFPLLGRTDPDALRGETVHLTYTTPDGPYTVTGVVGGS